MKYNKMFDFIMHNQNHIRELFPSENELFIYDYDIKLLEEYIHDKENPVWKDIYIDNKKTQYQVSNTGLIRNTSSGLIRRQDTNDAYLATILYLGYKSIPVLNHRMVATYFLPDQGDKNKNVVDHINGNKKCNWYKNLEWVTSKENKRRAIELGLDNPHHRNQPKGYLSGKATHTEEDAHRACMLLERGLSNKDIAFITKLDKEFVRTLRKKTGWRHVSDNYNIPGSEERNYYPPDMRLIIKELIDKGFDDVTIAETVGLDNPKIYGRKYVNKIRSRYNIEKSSTTIP